MKMTKRTIIAILLKAKEGIICPTFLSTLFTYDFMGEGEAHDTKDLNAILCGDIRRTRTTVSKLNKRGYVIREGKGMFKTTDKWDKLKKDLAASASNFKK